MKLISIIGAFFGTFAAILGCFGQQSDVDIGPFSRSDCIVKVAIDSELDASEKESAISEMFRAAYSSPTDSYDGPMPVMQVGVERDSVYLQFTERCSSRLRWAEEFVSERLDPATPEGMQLVVLRDRIEPGLDTISAYGPQWSDGEAPPESSRGLSITVDQDGISDVSPVER